MSLTVMFSRISVALRSHDRLRRAVDFLFAAFFFRLSPDVRSFLFRGERHECPICGAHLSHFLVLHRPFFRWCPVCRSLQRHRSSWLYIRQRILPARPVQRVLHFAPEPALTQAFHRLPGITYVSLDLCNPRVTIRANAEHLPFTSEAFDLIYCSHVLEHVPDDRTAMHEMYRVMRCGGVAIILIPLWNKPTYEDQSITDPCERERLFGQFDHVRWYGLDIIERLTDAGFAVQTVRIGDVAHACAIEHFGLDANEILFVCTIGQPRMSPLTDLLQPEGEHP